MRALSAKVPAPAKEIVTGVGANPLEMLNRHHPPRLSQGSPQNAYQGYSAQYLRVSVRDEIPRGPTDAALSFPAR